MRSRRTVVWWLVAACAQPAAHTTKPRPSEPPSTTPATGGARAGEPLWPRTTTTRSSPTAFLDVPGLQRVTIANHMDDEFGSSDRATVDVLRDGKVVCEFPFGGRYGAENHSGYTLADLILASRAPLRFYVRTGTTSNDAGSSEHCTGFELRDGEACRKLFDRECVESECKLTYTTALVPGTGRVRGTIARDGEPFVGGVVQLESQIAISDEHGAFSIDAGAGVHELTILGTERVYAPNPRVSLRRHQDAEVTIAIACPCCEP